MLISSRVVLFSARFARRSTFHLYGERKLRPLARPLSRQTESERDARTGKRPDAGRLSSHAALCDLPNPAIIAGRPELPHFSGDDAIGSLALGVGVASPSPRARAPHQSTPPAAERKEEIINKTSNT